MTMIMLEVRRQLFLGATLINKENVKTKKEKDIIQSDIFVSSRVAEKNVWLAMVIKGTNI